VTDWTALLLQVALTVVGAAAAERVRTLRRRPAFTGLLFGVLSAGMLFVSVGRIDYYGLAVSLHLAPVVVAAFFFGPVAGLVAGGISSVACGLVTSGCADMLLAVRGALATEAVALYAVAIGKWVFDDRRPPVCTAAIASAYGVIVFLTVGALFGLDDLPRTLEIVVASFVPLTVGMGLSAGLSALASGDARTWRLGFRSALNLVFVFIGLAVAATTVVIGLNAREEGEAIVRHAMLDLTAEMESQARYMLHESAVNIIDAMEGFGRAPTREDLVQYAKMFDVDGVTVADTNGLAVASTEQGLAPGLPVERDPDILRLYREMYDGSRPFVCPPFMSSGGVTGDYVKHFALPLPKGGFLRLAYLWSKFQFKFPQYIKPTLEGRHVGEMGFYLIFGEQGLTELAVPGRPETKGLAFGEVGLDEKALSKPYEKAFHARILGVLCWCVAFEPIGKYRMFAVLPLAETQGPALAISTVVALVLMIICIVFRVIQIRFQRAQAKIDALRAKEEQRRKADLALARAIQRAELRTDGTDGDGYRISSLMNAAREVGGDFYDYYELPDGRLVVTVADVSGKGIPAAIFMMKARMTLKSCVYSSATLAEAVAKANVRLSANNPADMFVTAWVGVYDRKTGAIDFVSAGHNPPLVRRRDGAVEWLQAPRSPAMGNFASARYRSAQTTLGAGDRLFLYTDGVNEAMNARGELFGNDRLFAALETAAGALVPAVGAAVEDFAAGAEQADDITMLELEIEGRR